MPAASIAGLRFPHQRVPLARTKLAYVHLRNLLSDAKRDRSARIFGYVAIWLPEGLVTLFMQEGEVVTATFSTDGLHYAPIAIADAVGRVPAEPELGEICFHEADDEQLACMYATQCSRPLDWPAELDPRDPRAIFPLLRATTFDGVVEIVLDDAVNFLVLRDGSVVRTFLADPSAGTVAERVMRLFAPSRTGATPRVRRWPVPPPLPVQANPRLFQAYRELTGRLVERLRAGGTTSAPQIAESARIMLAERHPALGAFAPGDSARDAVASPAALTAAAASWVKELLWATSDFGGATPEQVLADLTRERRHMLQSAGFFELLPWTVTW